MQKIQIGKQSVPLRFDMTAYEMIWEQYGSYGEMLAKLNAPGIEHLRTRDELLAIFANAVRVGKGGEPDYTAAWFRARLSPARNEEIEQLVRRVIEDGMRIDLDADEDDDPDTVLLEIERENQKKTEPAACTRAV